MRVAVAVAVHAQSVRHVDIQHILCSDISDDRLAGVRHGFKKSILRCHAAPHTLGLLCFTGGMNIGLAVGGADPDADVLHRAAHTGHGMTLEMREDQYGVIALQSAADDILI